VSGRLSRADRGAVTAELAMSLPLLLAVTVGLVWLLAVAAAQIQVIDAARETARSVARGDDERAALVIGRRIAPNGARIDIERGGDRVIVTASGRVQGPDGLFGFLPAARVSAESVALLEAAAGEGRSR